MDDRRLSEARDLISPLPLDENFLAALFGGIVDAVLAVDLSTGLIIYWNIGAERMFGYVPDEALHRTIGFLLPDSASFDRMHETIASDIQKNGFWRESWSCRRRDGSTFPAEMTATLIPFRPAAVPNVVVVVRDVTERMELESRIHRINRELIRRASEGLSELVSTRHELAEAEADSKLNADRFRLLTEGVKDCAILTLDVGGHVTSWNSSASRIFGYQESEIVGKHFSRFFQDSYPWLAEAPEPLERATAQGTIDQRARLLCRDGSTIDADVIIAPFHDTERQLKNFSMIIRDVSERVAIRQKLREQEHLATIGTTAAMFAHEVSNPLNSISTSIQLLERTISNETFAVKQLTISSLNDINIEIRRLRSLLDDFRNLARPTVLNTQPLDLAELVRELVQISAATFRQAKIDAVEDIPATLPLINGDPDKLKQAVLNLVKNAVEAMPQGGTITIKGYERGTHVCLEIADTGIGIPRESRIFDVFHTTKPGGTGLGLAIVQQIIATHGGSITYSSRPGSGTTFQLLLPAAAKSG